MKTDAWNVNHYAIACGLLALYGIAVCPLLESLSVATLMVPMVIAFGCGLLVRNALRRWLLSSDLSLSRPRRAFIIEWATLLAVGFGLAVFNHTVLEFPFASHSGLKVVLGVASIGFFVSIDVMLHEQMAVGRHLKQEGIAVQLEASRQSFSRRLFVLSTVSILVVSMVLVLLIYKQLLFLSWQESLEDLNKVWLAILFESVFVVAIMTAYIAKVMKSSSRVLAFYLGNQKDALERVSEGNYTGSVPVVSRDEFGDIARHTNDMIQTIAARSAELQRTQDATILALAALAETRDNETGAHIMRTQYYVRELAEYLANQPAYRDTLTPDTVKLIYKSTPLHDIGKVGIPDDVLLKPGKLSEDEYEIMKTHTTLGLHALVVVETELGQSNFLNYAKDVVATHHERWDGNGYPAGLAGESIPLCGRLMAVADVYDALTSKRVYKPAFSHEKARSIILEGRGSQFDPTVVDAFVECESAFIAIANRHSDGEPEASQSLVA